MADEAWYEKAWDRMDNEDYVQAIVFFEKAIEEGDIEAYCDLGNLYFNGNGVEQDYKRAFELYQKGAKAGDPYCMDNLGMCYFWGHGTETDIQKSAYYTERAAKAGIERAMYDTGLNYERGYGVSQNIKTSIEWLEKAAEENYTNALVELGDLYYVGEYVEKDLEKAFYYYNRGVELGDFTSKLLIAVFYEKGIVVEKDIEKARTLYQEAYDYYYEQAVTEDNSEAQFRLGNMYYSGLPLIGIDRNYTQASEWYAKAAENGYDHAQNNLGNMYAFGMGVAQNYERAFFWYLKAAERMNLLAMNNVANFYHLGRGVEQNYFKAAEYHSKAANLGHANSQEVLGEMYMEGKGVEQNYTKAVFWLKKSCENGERSAFGPLGNCYREGLGVDKDENKAFELYEKGAEMGDLKSKLSMAESLIEGWGTPCDCNHAYQILKAVCNDEEKYRENLVTLVEREGESGRIYMEDPLDKENLPYYAKAYYLFGVLCYSGSGIKKDAGEAIRLLRVADKLGYQNEDTPDETAEKLLCNIIEESEKEDVCDTVDCYVEVREENDRGERYKVILHHADGTESVAKLRGRNKFVYLLALLIAHEGRSVYGMTTTHFSFMHEDLADMASDLRVNTNSYEDWIDEFIYVEKPEAESMRKFEEFQTIGYCSLDSSRYSNAVSGANRAIKDSCISSEEFETFKLRSTGGRSAVTTMSIDSSQIELPNSLMVYLDCLPSQNKISLHKPKMAKWLPIKE